MQIYHLKADAQGRAIIRNLEPGEIITVMIPSKADAPDAEAPHEPLTLQNAKTDEEKAQVVAEIKARTRRIRELLKEDLPAIDELYDENGLPG